MISKSVLVVLALMALAWGASAVLGQQALQGRFAFSQSESERAALEQAIATAVAALPAEVRRQHKAKLTLMTRPVRVIELGRQGQDLSFKAGSREALTSRDDGSAKLVRGDAQLSQRMERGELVQQLSDAGFVRDYRYLLGRDGTTLTLRVKVTGGQLAAPLEYQLTYTKLP
jgi:hypothetical protein